MKLGSERFSVAWKANRGVSLVKPKNCDEQKRVEKEEAFIALEIVVKSAAAI